MSIPITHDLKDAKLTAAVSIPAAASTTVSSEPIDIGQEGGIDECQLVIECPAPGTDAVVTFTVLSSTTPDGSYSACSFACHATGSEPVKFRNRVPLDAHRYIKLQAVTGSTAPAAAVTATMSLCV